MFWFFAIAYFVVGVLTTMIIDYNFFRGLPISQKDVDNVFTTFLGVVIFWPIIVFLFVVGNGVEIVGRRYRKSKIINKIKTLFAKYLFYFRSKSVKK